MFKNNNQPVGEQPTAIALATVQQNNFALLALLLHYL